MQRYLPLAITALLTLFVVGSCSSPPKRLEATARRSCLAQGGYESRSAFGFPICQFRYADGGKTCSGKVDCQGQCLISVDGPPEKPLPKSGDWANGTCQSEQYSPGCFVEIEDGRIGSEGAFCED